MDAAYIIQHVSFTFFPMLLHEIECLSWRNIHSNLKYNDRNGWKIWKIYSSLSCFLRLFVIEFLLPEELLREIQYLRIFVVVTWFGKSFQLRFLMAFWGGLQGFLIDGIGEMWWRTWNWEEDFRKIHKNFMIKFSFTGGWSYQMRRNLCREDTQTNFPFF